MNKVLIDLHFLPSLEYFCALIRHDVIIIEKQEHFIKQSFHNRCYILGPNKIERLVIPVCGGHSKLKISEIKIDYSQKWVNQHWRSIQSAYGKAPFYEYLTDDFNKLLIKRHESLFELNFHLLTICLKILGLQPEIRVTETFQKESTDGLLDLRNHISPKKPWQSRSFYEIKPYAQVFGNKFVENLSIIDLLFCEGKQAIKILRNSSVHT